jgi:acyl-CoA reductase-like NAD-dependent aldehyde dehydrogenase
LLPKNRWHAAAVERSRAFKILTWWEVQRCTAIKQIMVHSDVAEEFVAKFTAKVGSLKLGLPWEAGVDLTPLAEPSKPHYLSQLCQVNYQDQIWTKKQRKSYCRAKAEGPKTSTATAQSE